MFFDFGILPEKLNDEELRLLVNHLREHGDCEICKINREYGLDIKHASDIKDFLIKSHIGLAIRISKRFRTSNTSLKSDLASVSLLSLTKAVNKVQEDMYNDEIGQFLTSRIAFSIRAFLKKQPLIRIPHDAFLKTHQPFKIDMLTPISVSSTRNKHLFELQLQVREILQKCTTSANHKIIADCMLQGGYKLHEMSALCGLSIPRVQQLRNQIEARFIKLWSSGE